jgi:hypothetical protein
VDVYVATDPGRNLQLAVTTKGQVYAFYITTLLSQSSCLTS